MADETLKRDANHVTVAAGVSNDASQEITQLRTDPVTDELLVKATIDPTGDNTVSTKTPLTGQSPTTASVGTSSGQILASNADRKGLVIINVHASNTVSLSFGTAAVLNSGITLYPRGGAYTMDEYTFSTQEVRAIASGASTTLSIQEFE